MKRTIYMWGLLRVTNTTGEVVQHHLDLQEFPEDALRLFIRARDSLLLRLYQGLKRALTPAAMNSLPDHIIEEHITWDLLTHLLAYYNETIGENMFLTAQVCASTDRKDRHERHLVTAELANRQRALYGDGKAALGIRKQPICKFTHKRARAHKPTQ